MSDSLTAAIPTEIDTHVLAKELRKRNAKRTPGEWRLHAGHFIVEQDRLAPWIAQTGGIRQKANADYLFYLASNSKTIIERLERLARLEKMIEEELGLPDDSSAKSKESDLELLFGETVASAEATSIQKDTPLVVGLA